MTSYFITATGTGIGKTLLTCALSWQLRQQGKSVTALKPVLSGYDALDINNDSGLILQACGLSPTASMMETISPWRYRAALSPNMAAAMEGKPVDFDALLAFCREHGGLSSDAVLVEGVGGLMAPVSDRFTVLDWIEALGWPVFMVTGSYLGAISHTLTAMESLKSRSIPLHALAISESAEHAVDMAMTAATLEKFLPDSIPIVKIPRIATSKEPWKQVPPLSWLCEKQR